MDSVYFRHLEDDLENVVIPSGHKIHQLVDTSFEVNHSVKFIMNYKLKFLRHLYTSDLIMPDDFFYCHAEKGSNSN